MELGMGWQTQRDFQLARRGENFTWEFTMVDVYDYATPKTGITPSVAISKDGGAFSTIGNGTEIGNGMYKRDITDTDYQTIVLKATASGCAQSDIVFIMV
jgi:hypothetical protein